MKQFFAGLWWWIRVIVLVVAGLYALALLWNNSKQTASIWYWPGRPVEETSIVALAIAAFVCGGLIMTISWALGTAMVNLRRTQAARRKRAAELAREEMERKASMLRVKPAPAPVVRPRPEPKPEPVHEAKPRPEPSAVVVEPMPEATAGPSPVVVIRQEKPAQPFADKPIVEKHSDTKVVESRVIEQPTEEALAGENATPVAKSNADVLITPPPQEKPTSAVAGRVESATATSTPNIAPGGG